MKRFYCPSCHRPIDNKLLAEHLASKGGKAKSEAKAKANREKMKKYWADVRAGKVPAPARNPQTPNRKPTK